jgi:hypothetical protein
MPERVSGIAAVNTFAWRPTGAFFRGMLTLMGSAAMREFDAATEFLPPHHRPRVWRRAAHGPRLAEGISGGHRQTGATRVPWVHA